ncbi:sensor histidine kinase [Actinomadura hibisca]|uniref:sensor histidine kinase n=1 Tax=Actinomadura hibisca TaxID=68565 RepID=UPI00082AE788|nr:ATP-binding protein [Actinomadura hibisca]
MTAHASPGRSPGHPAGHRVDRAPMERALLTWLIAVVVIGGGWLWAVVAVEPAAKRLVAIGGGGAALALALAVAVAAYHATAARRARAGLGLLEGGTAHLEQQIQQLCERSLPVVIARVREGAPADTAVAEAPRPTAPALVHLLRLVARELADAERSLTAARAANAAAEDEADHLIRVVVPRMVKQVREQNASANTLLSDLEVPGTEHVARFQHAFAHELARTQELTACVLMACSGAAARLQAQATSMLALLRALQHRYDEQEVFDDLLDIDHRVSQMGRLADSIALLSGGRTGRRWTKPIIMESILRGAMGRIADYRRVKLHSTNRSAVAGHAAEGVMHALAELMDNATIFSTRDNDVHVYVEEEDAGVVVTVEDSGLGMRRRERERAERLIANPTDMTSLPGTRLGLAVVGRLAHKHRLRVNFRPSSRGGIGVVMMIPRHIITRPLRDPFADYYNDEPPSPADALVRPPLPAPPRPVPPAHQPARQPAHQLARQAPPVPQAPAPGSGPAGGDDDFADLPQRRKGETLANSPYHQDDPIAAPVRDRHEAAARMGAFHAAGRGRKGTAAGRHSTEQPDPQSTDPRGAGPLSTGPQGTNPLSTGPQNTGPQNTDSLSTGPQNAGRWTPETGQRTESPEAP